MRRLVQFSLAALVAAPALSACFGVPGAEGAADRDEDCRTPFYCYVSARDARDVTTASRLYDKACAAGEVHACLALGDGYRRGSLIFGTRTGHDNFTKDPQKAFAAYKRACELPERSGCLPLATMVEAHEVPGQDDASAWFEKVCRAKDNQPTIDPCGKAAKAYAGRGDEAHALELLRIGCNRYYGGCAEVGRAELADGDVTSAKAHLDSACFYGHEGDACFDLATLAEKEGKLDDARRAYEDACKRGRQDACARVESMSAAQRTAAEAKWKADRARDDAAREARQKELDAEAKRAEGEARRAGGAASAGRTASTGSGGTSSGSTSSISMTDANADGMHATNLSCSLQNGNMLDSFVLLAALGERKRALTACGIKPGAPFRAEWTMRGGAVSPVHVSGTGSQKTDACAVRAMRQLKQRFTGQCTASLSIER